MPRSDLQAPSSPYQQLRRNRQIKLEIHSQSAAANSSTAPISPVVTPPSSFSPPPPSSSFSPPPSSSSFPTSPSSSSATSTLTGRKNVWIKPKNNAVQVPSDILELLVADIERRHAGQLQPEEIVWYQGPSSFGRAIRTSWATGLALMLSIVSIFVCVGIVFYAPAYLRGAAALPPVVAAIVIVLLIKRIRIDLSACYALTRTRAIIIVPKRHLGVLKPLVLNFDFLTEKNLIMLQYQEARLQDRILTREPVLADLIHDPHAVATVSFYPRSEFKVPFRFRNVNNSHAFELDFSDTMTHTATPVGGGRLRIEKPDFEQQRIAARKYKIYPIIGIVWGLVIIGVLSGILLGGWFTKVTDDKITIAMVILAWFFAVTLSIASLYPIYSLARGKREAMANARYVKYIIDKN